MYEEHFIPMIKHLERQIFQEEAQMMTDKEQSDFLQNVLDPDGINDPNKA
jgi:hypothetical protein